MNISPSTQMKRRDQRNNNETINRFNIEKKSRDCAVSRELQKEQNKNNNNKKKKKKNRIH